MYNVDITSQEVISNIELTTFASSFGTRQ